MKPNIVIVGTGGTLASVAPKRDAAHYSQAEASVDALVKRLPELDDIAHIQTEQLVQINSENMTEAVWFKLAKRVQQLVNQDDIDGIVITHGTDTMEETAYFLNLVIHTQKPITITGAMRPLNALSADGLRNLYQAVLVAAQKVSSGRGVLVVLNDVIHQARDVTKVNINSIAAFDSPNYGKVGHIHNGEVYFYRNVDRVYTDRSEFHIDQISALPKVYILYGAVGNDRTLVDACVQNGAKGIISAGLGMGYQPELANQALIDATHKGVVVVRCSRVKSGIVTPEKSVDEPHGFVAAGSLSPQKARILLALALTKTSDPKTIQAMFDRY